MSAAEAGANRPDGARTQRIVVIRTSALGDAVLATPAMRALHGRFPDASVELVTHGALAPLFEGLPYLSRVWRWEPKGRDAGARGLLQFARSLREPGPVELVVDLQNKPRTRVLSLALRPRKRITMVKRDLGDLARVAIHGDRILDSTPAAALYLEAMRSLGLPPVDLVPDVALPATAHAAAERLLADAGAAPIAALAPGARWALKRWSPERFAEVGDALAAAGARLVLAGGPGDLRELEAVRRLLKAAPLGDTAGLDVAGLAAVLARCEVLVTADSAPSHIAQAVRTPVVAVFGPTSSRRWGPVAGAGAAISLPVACAPCSNHGSRSCKFGHRICLEGLPADPVIAAALAAVRAGRTEGGRAAAEAARMSLVPLALRAARLQVPVGGKARS